MISNKKLSLIKLFILLGGVLGFTIQSAEASHYVCLHGPYYSYPLQQRINWVVTPADEAIYF